MVNLLVLVTPIHVSCVVETLNKNMVNIRLLESWECWFHWFRLCGGYNKTCKLGSDRLQIITVVFFKYV